jgi:peptidyl-prolyl cis-trans isomerase B (cyclophilin B)
VRIAELLPTHRTPETGHQAIGPSGHQAIRNYKKTMRVVSSIDGTSNDRVRNNGNFAVTVGGIRFNDGSDQGSTGVPTMVHESSRRWFAGLLIIACAVLLSAVAEAEAQTIPKQAVLETSAGTIVMDLLADKAPNHVALFVKTAQSGGYDGTTFFRMVKHAIIQAGDPLTKDAAARAKYGSGGLNLLKPELTDEKQTRGAVSATQIPGKPDSAGTQFFIAVTDQPGLDGRYTIFARVVEGILVAQKISEAAVDSTGLATDRIVINKVSIRDKPAEAPEPFSTEATQELQQYRAVLDTSMGEITLSFTPDKAPNHVRNFLRLAQAGVYDGMSFHRVVKGFVIQSGHLPSRSSQLNETQQKYIRQMPAEFNDQIHEKGTLSMARLADPNSASTSFFIVTARTQSLDNQYTVFGKVESGLDVVEKIEAVPVNGEEPAQRVELRKVTIIKK